MESNPATLGPVYGPTWRSRCGAARVTYRGDWDSTRPFIAYRRGTAGRHYPTLRAALFDLERAGFRFA